MADGLSTGIALSGQLKVDDSAQQNLLQAERAAAQERMAQKAALDKEQKAFEDEVRKNTLINSNLKTNFYQKDFSNRANSTMADIIGGIKRGEITQAQAYGKLQEFKNYTDQIRIADQGLYDGLSAVAKDPAVYDAVGRYDIGGKTYRTFAEALNDPFVRTPEGFEQLKGQFRGTEYEFRQTTPEEKAQGMPDYVVGYSPLAVTDEQDILEGVSKTDEYFTVVSSNPKDAFRIPGTGEVQMPVHTSIDPSTISQMVQGFMGNESIKRGYEKRLKNEFLDANPNATDADWYDSKEYTDFLNNASQRLGGKIESLKKTKTVEASIDKDDERSPNTGARFSNKKIAVFDGEDLIRDVKQPWSADGATGENYNYLAVAAIEPKTGDVKSNIDIGAGTLIWDSEKGVLRQPKDFEKNAPATPHEMVVLSDGKTQKPYIRYLSALSAEEATESLSFNTGGTKSGDKYKGRTQESFYIPATEANLKRLAESTDTGIEEWNSLKIELQKRATKGGSTSTTDAGTGGGVMGGTGGGPDSKSNPKEVERKDPKSGKVAIFDADTKKFIRWK